MRTCLLVVVAMFSVVGPVAAEEVKKVTAPTEFLKAPKWVGRRLQTGMNSRDSSLETFTLQRVGDRALLTVEALSADTTDDGKFAPWKKLSFIQYLGTATTVGDVVTFKLANRPLSLEWTCKITKLDVAAATAVRGRDPKWKGKDCGDPGRWEPAATQKVSALQCTQFYPSDDEQPPVVDSKDNLAFAPAPGIEWLWVNDECVIEGGGWRRVPAKPTLAVPANDARAKGVVPR